VAKTPSKVYSNANNTHYYEPVLPLYADTPKVVECLMKIMRRCLYLFCIMNLMKTIPHYLRRRLRRLVLPIREDYLLTPTIRYKAIEHHLRRAKQ
jgi:hypothetical protein